MRVCRISGVHSHVDCDPLETPTRRERKAYSSRTTTTTGAVQASRSPLANQHLRGRLGRLYLHLDRSTALKSDNKKSTL